MNGCPGSCIWCLAAFLSAATLQARAADTTALGRSLEGLGQKQGWALEESLRVYEGNGLYELVDGGATLYLEYGFVRAFALRFARGQSRLSVELYQMSGAEAAYGIFSYLAAGSISAPAACGEQGGRGDGFVLFWKGPYAVTVTTLEGEDSAALGAFASAVDRELPAGGTRPEAATVLRRLGAGDLVFFRGPLGYQKTRGLLPADFLRVGEGAMGTIDGCTAVALTYENPDTCRSVLWRALRLLGSASQVQQDAAGALVRFQGQLYALRSSGRRILQVRGDEKSKIQHLASQLQSAFVH